MKHEEIDMFDDIEVDMDKEVDVITGKEPKEGESHGRVDSPNGAHKYFSERFAKFVK